ncbi:MAG: chromate resistance protein [Acidobacteria bacterium]|nr:chromate resistance protein [Acidobacteriota bacterium]
MTHDSTPWLLLLSQLPARPTAARVRTWRQLQRLGAVPVRNSGYALPATPQSREDFEWLRADIVSAGGSATLFQAATVDPAAHAELIAAFTEARRADFEALRRDTVAARRRRATNGAPRRDVRVLMDRLAHLESIDFFGAGAATGARGAVDALRRTGKEGTMTASAVAQRLSTQDFKGRRWVTRPRPGIDRFASAWLIRRFIDPRARFQFAAPGSPAATRRGVVPFDMFGVEFGHQAGGCTFETLVRRFGIQETGIDWLATLVHALDLKDDSTPVPEAPAVARLVDGLRDLHANDAILLERGMELIEALYRSRLADAGTPTRSRKRKPRAGR